MTLTHIIWIILALIAIVGVADIIRKTRRGRRPLSSHRPDARNMEIRSGSSLSDTSTEGYNRHMIAAAQDNTNEDDRHRRTRAAREEADKKAERARRIRPWDNH